MLRIAICIFLLKHSGSCLHFFTNFPAVFFEPRANSFPLCFLLFVRKSYLLWYILFRIP